MVHVRAAESLHATAMFGDNDTNYLCTENALGSSLLWWWCGGHPTFGDEFTHIVNVQGMREPRTGQQHQILNSTWTIILLKSIKIQ